MAPEESERVPPMAPTPCAAAGDGREVRSKNTNRLAPTEVLWLIVFLQKMRRRRLWIGQILQPPPGAVGFFSRERLCAADRNHPRQGLSGTNRTIAWFRSICRTSA